jgi:hypothetical protein
MQCAAYITTHHHTRIILQAHVIKEKRINTAI